MGVVLDLFELSENLKVCYNCFSCSHCIHTRVFSAVENLGFVFGEAALCLKLLVSGNVLGSCHKAVVGEHANDRKIAALTYLVVVGVVSGRDLYNARTFFHVGVLVADNRDFFIQQRQNYMAAVQVLISFVVLVNGNGGIAEHCFGTGCGYFKHFARFLNLVEDVPEVAVLLLVLNLGVGNRGVAVRAPVYHAVAAIDFALVIKLYENFLNSVRAALVKRKALAAPVAAYSKLSELTGNSSAVLALPFPRALKEFFASQIVFGNAFLAHSLNNFRLGGDRGVVGAGQPKRAVARHSFPADQNVLQCFVKRVADVQLTRDVGRRHDDGVRFFVGIDFGMKVVALYPEVVNAILKRGRVIGFFKFLCHNYTPCYQELYTTSYYRIFSTVCQAKCIRKGAAFVPLREK